jgi:c-di-GMP-binding flagellar brake protein YcgR
MTYTDRERREFFRLNYSQPLQYRTAGPIKETAASSRNISQTGILFRTETRPPEISSLLWLDLDIRTLKICQEIEGKALIFNNGLIGKVVRVEEDAEAANSFDVGVCFLRKDEAKNRDVQKLLAELESSQKSS